VPSFSRSSSRCRLPELRERLAFLFLDVLQDGRFELTHQDSEFRVSGIQAVHVFHDLLGTAVLGDLVLDERFSAVDLLGHHRIDSLLLGLGVADELDDDLVCDRALFLGTIRAFEFGEHLLDFAMVMLKDFDHISHGENLPGRPGSKRQG
jgi:hypothetical protein